MNKQLVWEINWVNNHPQLYEGYYHQKAVIGNITKRYYINELLNKIERLENELL